ncbi:glycosyltransferase family 4 protein [Hydrogenophaga luteola]|uniref:Glycosyltransferase family 4 protein n=1 Tax=Hydrogenophaga luteola TaxID=1591122 RepID=A0ABV7W7F7_9BURK
MSVPAGIQAMVAIRPDLRHLDIARFTDRLALYALWEGPLHRDYPEVEWRLSDKDKDHLRAYSMAQFLADGGAGLSCSLKGNWPTVLDLMPGFDAHSRRAVIGEAAFTDVLPLPLQMIWRDRPDLQTLHDTTTKHGRAGFLQWWLRFGHMEHPRVDWVVGPELSGIDHLGPQERPWPRFLTLVVQGRNDLDETVFGPNTEAGWFNGLVWWHQSGFAEFGVAAWSLLMHTPLRRLLHGIASAFDARDSAHGACAKALPYVLYRIWTGRADLRTAFDLRQPSGCDGLLAWWQEHGLREHHSLVQLFQDPLDEQAGMNIVGYARSVIGIAEDVRMAVRSAELAGIPCAVIDAPIKGPQKVDHSLDGHIVDQPRWPVTLYCLPPTEIIRLGLEGGRKLLDAGTYNIGGWHWELPVWPEHLTGVIDSVDEVWVYSEFVRQAFAGKTDKPVHKMPLAVELPAHPGANRAQFGLSANRFLFLVMFDGASWLSRKNPVAAVRAFKQAFGNDPNVGLVIKAISLDRSSEGWQTVAEEIAGDDRVTVIDRTMDRVELVQLMSSCDAYVSLHRSEGFGRIIAEAMLLGLPTVTTAFSGNTDFCTPETSFLVDGPLVPLSPEDYIFHQGQYWCDPDVEQAASQMRRLVDRRDETASLVRRAQDNIRNNYSSRAVADAYRRRLRELRQAYLI